MQSGYINTYNVLKNNVVSTVTLPNGDIARAHFNNRISISNKETEKANVYSDFSLSEFPIGHLAINPATGNLVVCYKNNFMVEFEVTEEKNLEFRNVFKIAKREKNIPVTCITILPQGDFVLGYADGRIEMFDQNHRLHKVTIKDSRIISIIHGQNGNIICSTSNNIILLDSTLSIVNLQMTNTPPTEVTQPTVKKIIATAILLDGNVARAHQDGKITIMNTETAEISGPFDASFATKSKSAIKHIAVHPETGNLIVCYANTSMKEFEISKDVLTFKKQFIITQKTILDKITCLAVLHDGNIAYGYEHGKVEVFDKELKPIALFDAKSSGHVTSIDYTHNGHYICTVNNTIKIFDPLKPEKYSKAEDNSSIKIQPVKKTHKSGKKKQNNHKSKRMKDKSDEKTLMPAKKRYALNEVEGEKDRLSKKIKIDMTLTLFNPACNAKTDQLTNANNMDVEVKPTLQKK